ncbi:hypothetical protein [Rufibacter psychrotolerans]|uniref:hypothetical protein n=1 Tax=Rufibacter psychrotolerans TaxID=2812556 RepID=UPI0019684B4B|nr:hypothetical protein [Rufibacter sp. SYSU D00308]
MKKLLLLLFLTVTAHFLQAQDLIVTQEGDSLNCKISKVARDRVYFTFVHKGEVRKTLLSRHLIKNYQHNFYATSALPEDYKYQEDLQMFPRLRLGVSGGWSYRLASVNDGVPADFKEYIEGLKKGYNISADAAYYFSEQMGAGLRYSTYRASNEINDVSAVSSGGTIIHGKMSDKISVTFVGPYFSSRMLSANKLNGFFANLGLGYLGYTDEVVQVNDRFTIKGSTVGLSGDLGYDVRIAKKLSLGFQLSMVTGTLREYEVSSGTSTRTVKLDQENYENLSRIDLSVGLRFNH